MIHVPPTMLPRDLWQFVDPQPSETHDSTAAHRAVPAEPPRKRGPRGWATRLPRPTRRSTHDHHDDHGTAPTRGR